ncbi:MAG: Hsp70 family protein [Selenomonadaceae bacterium]|nr:Hsp70 family protein [Selenomonadaceae bacterium]
MKIGIDFGTSFSLPAGLINDDCRRLLPDKIYGVPSVFYYDKRQGIMIGGSADNRGKYRPENVVRNVKMEISNPSKKTFNLDGKTFNKKQIVGRIINEVKKLALEEISRKQLVSREIDGAVISVPAAFTLRELNFIREAAQDEANLKVLGFIREPVAAAISYFNAPAAEDKKTILVYDLGGGTCDVAIVRSDKNSKEWYKVIDSDMQRIGGRDWDRLLCELIKRKCREENPDIEFDLKAESKILAEAIKVKHDLSRLENALLTVEIEDELYDIEITRAEFEKITSELLQETMHMVDKLKSNCMTKIDHIICVGGSSNMPQVRKAFEKNYPDIGEENIIIFEPENSIAFGAAIYAEHLTEETFLHDICKFSYGARYVQDFDRYKDYNRLRIYNIIYKGDDLPTSGESTSQHIDDNTDTYIAVYESECTDEIYMPKDGTYIGEIKIQGLRDSRKGDETFLTMTIDRSGLMQLKALDKRTGKSAKVDIQLEEY